MKHYPSLVSPRSIVYNKCNRENHRNDNDNKSNE